MWEVERGGGHGSWLLGTVLLLSSAGDTARGSLARAVGGKRATIACRARWSELEEQARIGRWLGWEESGLVGTVLLRRRHGSRVVGESASLLARSIDCRAGREWDKGGARRRRREVRLEREEGIAGARVEVLLTLELLREVNAGAGTVTALLC